MEMNIQLVFLVLVLNLSLGQAFSCPPLPDNGGEWEQGNKNGSRCILRCKDGFEPSGCHVIRNKQGKWTNEIPRCVKESFVSLRTIGIGVVAGTAAVVAAPVLLAAAGFTHAGVAAGSLAASVQGPATAAGSWFAICQSAGTVGFAATAKATIWGAASTITTGAASGVTSVYNILKCERE